MLKIRRLIAIALLAAVAAPASAATPPALAAANAPALAPDQARNVLDILQNDQRRAELIATLQTIAKAAPVAAAPTPAAPQAPPAPAVVPTLAPDSLGVQLFNRCSAMISVAAAEFLASIRTVNDLPLLWRWIKSQASDPIAQSQAIDAGWKLAVVLLCALLAEFATARVLRRLRGTLEHWSPQATESETGPAPATAEAAETQRKLNRTVTALRRLPFLLGRLLLDLLPIGAFLLAGDLLLGTELGTPDKTRLVVLEVLEAYATVKAILALAAFLVAPASPRMRLLHVSDWGANFLTRVIRRTVIVVVTGTTITNIGLLFGMYRTAHDAALKLFGLVVHIGLVIAVLQARKPVAARLRARSHARGLWASMLNRFAEVWHLVAIFYIVALWFVWAVEIRDGYVRLLNFGLVTGAVLLGGRLLGLVLLGVLDRTRAALAEGSGLAGRATAYFPVLRTTLAVVLWCVTGFALLQVWGFDPVTWFGYGGLGGRVLRAVLLIGLISLLALAVWEATNAVIDRHLAELSQSAQLARAGRLRTLLPLLRTTLLVTIVLLVGLMALSELGVNVAPLLAGAGVVGIAVGFGSQKLVQDLITGLFLLLENAMQVGDVVTVAGLTGTVEALSIRTIRLRALDGSVHLIPFSSVTTVTNQTRDYSYAVVDVSVGLNEEPETITKVLREVAESMRADQAWSSIILDKLDVMGVEKLTDLAWIMRLRLKTQPGSRWAVGRELNRRIKERFDEQAIESPFTSHRVLGREPPPPVPADTPEEQAA